MAVNLNTRNKVKSILRALVYCASAPVSWYLCGGIKHDIACLMGLQGALWAPEISFDEDQSIVWPVMAIFSRCLVTLSVI